jgi:hypothetical protein
MTNHARKAAEEISRWVCSVIVKYDGPISHFDGSNPFEQIIAPHFSTAIADATAEQGRQLEAICGALADAGTVLAARQDGDYAASVRELTRERDELKAERLLLARLAKCQESPQFYNPIEAMAAKALRDRVLATAATATT